MGHNTDQIADCRQSFFRRLIKDTAANTLAISAAAVVPLLAMVGGGVDASRYYMAETRLQAACDSGALAARRAMSDDTFTTEHRKIANTFFDQNFQEGSFGVTLDRRRYRTNAKGEVRGIVDGTMPTSIMGIFGYQQFDLTIRCNADINYANTDIMFVLDVTHSMNCPADNAGCDNSYEWANSKLDNVRTSVLAFYDTIEGSTAENAQIRYGMMPYAQQVNVGDSLDPNWLANSHTYQSREAKYVSTNHATETWEYVRGGSATNWVYIEQQTNQYNGSSQAQCDALSVTESDIYSHSDTSAFTVDRQYGSPQITEYSGPVSYYYYDFISSNFNPDTGICYVTRNHWNYDATSRIYHYPAGSTSNDFYWAYKPVTYDVSNVPTTGSLTATTGWNGASVTHNWNGCIEEADTVTTATWSPLPANAHDLNIDLVPSNENEKWKPMMPSLVWQRYTDDTDYFVYDQYWRQDEVVSQKDKGRRNTWCPKAARKLDAFGSRDDLETWLSAADGFVVAGNTYHDYGMIWGARFISPDGIFASENATAPNGDAISRHVIFMTDGEQATAGWDYTPHGIEWWDRRVTDDGSEAQLADRHASRFQAACKAARNKNISVWVVAFGTTLTQNLIDCATPGRAYQAADADELEQAFIQIAAQIAALRLTN